MRRATIIIKAIIFSVLFGLIFMYVNEVVRFKQLALPWNMTNKITGLRYEPEDSMDVMYFGSSHMYCSVNPVVMWETYGIPSYSFATQQQPVWITYHYMKEALKYQTPKVIVMDVLMTKQQTEYSEEGINRTAIDLLPNSLNRLAMIQAAVPKAERASYVINFIKYHSRWQELKETDWDWANAKLLGAEGTLEGVGPTDTDPLKGYVLLDKISPMPEMVDFSTVEEVTPLMDKVETYLLKIIELTKEKGIELVLYKAPSNASVEEKQYFNAVEQLAEEHDVLFVDYNEQYETLGLDVAEDFYDKGHVNYVGAEKVTKTFGELLQSTFQLPDKRENEAYQEWDEDVAYYHTMKAERPLKVVEE